MARDVGVELAAALKPLARMLLKVGEEHRWQPTTDSELGQAMTQRTPSEAETRKGVPSPLTVMCEIVFARTFALVDNLRAVSMLAAQGGQRHNIIALSLAPVGRAALEGLAYIYWQCEPGLDVDERIARMAIDELYSQGAMSRLNQWAPEGQTFEPNWAEYERIFDAWGIPTFRAGPHAAGPLHVKDAAGKGRSRPTAQAIIAPLMRAEQDDHVGAFIYKMLADLSHASITGILGSADTLVDDVGKVHYRFYRERELVDVGILPWALHRPLQAYFALMGWDVDRLDDLVGEGVGRMTPLLQQIAVARSRSDEG